MTTHYLYSVRQDTEILTSTTIDEAVQQYAEEIYPDEIPEKVKVYEWKPSKVDGAIIDIGLEQIMERLDEEYADPSEIAITEPNSKIKEAFDAFKKVLQQEYTPWICETTSDPITVNTREYLD